MTTPKTTVHQRIETVRAEMSSQDVTALIVPTADPHLSEYLPEYWQAREWLTGFTGSVGTLVMTADFAGLWTDSRYWVQAADELAETGIHLQKLAPSEPTHVDWLVMHLSAGDSVAVDGQVLSITEQDRLLEALDAKDITLITERDLLSHVWMERPSLPTAALYPHDGQFVAQSCADKLTAVRAQMIEAGATHHLLSSLDDIAWLTNLRGADVDYNPVFLAHVLISSDSAVLFVDQNKVSDEIATTLAESCITLADYAEVQAALGQLSAHDILLLDPNKVAVGTLAHVVDDLGFIEQIAPSTYLKSIKSPSEIAHIREAMRQDGAALCAFFAELESKLEAGEQVTELDVDAMLIDVRSQQPHYVSPSFPTIAGFAANGALPHYRATEAGFSVLSVPAGEGSLLLIDSGAQYQNGTTDITRVVGIGEVSADQRRDFTYVLKAHIALAAAHFPEGISSPLIDAICRAPLWQAQMDYGHGTGHGVGYFLNVHEGPQGISYSGQPTKARAMRAGMLTSNEPGLYREGKWGIRIENLVVCHALDNPNETEFGNFLHFETVTYCPIDTRLIDKTLLTAQEIDWLNDYHRMVYDALRTRVSGAALEWLSTRTQSI
ncbi:aminopeptidase P family protein [Psychrobacter aestuarii]|uniref:Aminopeptidase P family protein n=1 Tax=Psychrobacter aestuarii TaxID=556327 RepID=A0ABP3FRA6_9GAMM|nr:aminopeptidase P family protein [Psychrobacter aestuarii]